MKTSVAACLLRGIVLAFIVSGCAGPPSHPKDFPLPPPEWATPLAGDTVREGNRLFAERQWTAAIKKYEEAVQAAPSLAEAHYNLAVTLDQQGRFSESRAHYKEAAKRAPRNPVIRNAPPFRQYGTAELDSQESASDWVGGKIL